MNCENCETDKKRGGYNVKKEEVAGLPEGLTNSTVNVLILQSSKYWRWWNIMAWKAASLPWKNGMMGTCLARHRYIIHGMRLTICVIYMRISKPPPYWINSSSNDIIKDMIARADRETKGQIEKLLNGGTIGIQVHEEVTYGDMHSSGEGYRKIDCYGISFFRKDCEVRFGTCF